MSIINVPNHDLKFYRGDTAIRTVKIWDESVKPRQLQDLTGATARPATPACIVSVKGW